MEREGNHVTTTLVSFKRTSADPADRSGIALLRYGELQVAAPIASIEHAQQLASWADRAIRQAKNEAMQAGAKYLRGAADAMEAGQ